MHTSIIGLFHLFFIAIQAYIHSTTLMYSSKINNNNTCHQIFCRGIQNITIAKSDIPSVRIVDIGVPRLNTSVPGVTMAVLELDETTAITGQLCLQASDMYTLSYICIQLNICIMKQSNPIIELVSMILILFPSALPLVTRNKNISICLNGIL